MFLRTCQYLPWTASLLPQLPACAAVSTQRMVSSWLLGHPGKSSMPISYPGHAMVHQTSDQHEPEHGVAHVPNSVHILVLHALATDPAHQPGAMMHLSTLKEQLTLRLDTAAQAMQTRLRLLNSTPGTPLAHLQHAVQLFPARLSHDLHHLGQFPPKPAAAGEQLKKYLSSLDRLHRALDSALLDLCAPFEKTAKAPGYWQHPATCTTCTQVLDAAHAFTISSRLLLAQHGAALHRLLPAPAGRAAGGGQMEEADGGHGSEHLDGGAMVVEMRGGTRHVRGDYKEPLPAERKPPNEGGQHRSLVLPKAPIMRLLRGVVQDCRAFCVEKNSNAPEVVLHGDGQLAAALVGPYFEYVVTEVLKNALQAVLKRHGAWRVDEAEPVQVHLWPDGPASFVVEVSDHGGGMAPEALQLMQHYYYSSAAQPFHKMGYGYSRDHGSTFHGLGVGAPMAKVYARVMGGQLEWESEQEQGRSTVRLVLPRGGFVV